MKAPSSTYKHWKISTSVRSRARYSLGECPRIFPLPAVNLVPVTDRTVQTSMPASFHAASSFSAKADMRNRSHVVTLLYSNGLGEFNYLFFNLENNDEVSVYACYSRDKAWRGAILFKYVKENVMVGCFISFDKINKSYMGRQIMIFL
jgi:hypothetical protein